MTTKLKIQFSELELVAIENALRLAATRYEEDEHDASCKPGWNIAEANARDRKNLAIEIANKIGDVI